MAIRKPKPPSEPQHLQLSLCPELVPPLPVRRTTRGKAAAAAKAAGAR